MRTPWLVDKGLYANHDMDNESVISFKWELSKSFNYLCNAYYLQNFKIPQEANMRFTHNQMAFLFLGLKRNAKEKNKLNLR